MKVKKFFATMGIVASLATSVNVLASSMGRVGYSCETILNNAYKREVAAAAWFGSGVRITEAEAAFINKKSTTKVYPDNYIVMCSTRVKAGAFDKTATTNYYRPSAGTTYAETIINSVIDYTSTVDNEVKFFGVSKYK